LVNGKFEALYAIHEWNQTQSGGFLRSGDAMEHLKPLLPAIECKANPNLVIAPRTANGVSQLDIMLASLLPDEVLDKAGIKRLNANFGLSTVGLQSLPKSFTGVVRSAFESYIWKKLSPAARLDPYAFSPNSSLRLLAGDAKFWMHRIYRVAIELRETMFDECEDSGKDGWEPLPELSRKLFAQIGEEERNNFVVRRPLMGGTLWNVDSAEEREGILQGAINGLGSMDSLAPVLEVMHGHRTHDDFSNRYSWVKEDFERSFYSKRSKIKVEMVETLDDAPVWSSGDNEGYEHALFRDVMAVLDTRERKLVVALRMGKTATEISREAGLAGHAAISRRISKIKAKVQGLLN